MLFGDQFSAKRFNWCMVKDATDVHLSIDNWYVAKEFTAT